MAQIFNPDNVLVSDTIGREITNPEFTQAFLQDLITQSLLVRLGTREDMNSKIVEKTRTGSGLTNAYFVDEGQKIGTAKIGDAGRYLLQSKKIGVILPVTEEALTYTWSNYFSDVIPLIVDEFNRKIDGAVFLGMSGNPFGTNVYDRATVVGGDYDIETLFALEDNVTLGEPTAFVGQRGLETSLRGLRDPLGVSYYERADVRTGQGTLDQIPYLRLRTSKNEDIPAGKENVLFAGNFDELRYGIPNGTNLRLKIADEATLSTIQNAGPDSGDVHLFEQDMQALRAIFEIAVAIPTTEAGAFTRLDTTLGAGTVNDPVNTATGEYEVPTDTGTDTETGV